MLDIDQLAAQCKHDPEHVDLSQVRAVLIAYSQLAGLVNSREYLSVNTGDEDDPGMEDVSFRCRVQRGTIADLYACGILT